MTAHVRRTPKHLGDLVQPCQLGGCQPRRYSCVESDSPVTGEGVKRHEEVDLTRYISTARIAILAGLASVAVLALSAAPAGATLVCPKGAPNQSYCTNVLPIAITGGATSITTTSATLNGVAGPGVAGGDITHYYFQYGKTKAYGSHTPTGTVGQCPPGTANQTYCPGVPATKKVSAKIFGLKPGQTYHFRIVSINSDGTSHGSDHTFTTHSIVPIKFVLVPKRVRGGHFFTVVVALKLRARVSISLLFHGRVVRSFNAGFRTGTVHQTIKAPLKKGLYTVRVKATAEGVTETIDRTITVF